jgi:hypothetical protein
MQLAAIYGLAQELLGLDNTMVDMMPAANIDSRFESRVTTAITAEKLDVRKLPRAQMAKRPPPGFHFANFLRNHRG